VLAKENSSLTRQKVDWESW